MDDRVVVEETVEEVIEEGAGVDASVKGYGIGRLIGPDGEVKQVIEVENLITQEGDRYYAERAAMASGFPNQITGMRLGSGTTAPAKTGAGAAIVTYVAGSNRALDSAPVSSLQGAARRITRVCTWPAGVGTNSALAEVALTNETPLTDVAGTAGNTIARLLLSPTVPKGAADTFEFTWTQDLQGS